MPFSQSLPHEPHISLQNYTTVGTTGNALSRFAVLQIHSPIKQRHWGYKNRPVNEIYVIQFQVLAMGIFTVSEAHYATFFMI